MVQYLSEQCALSEFCDFGPIWFKLSPQSKMSVLFGQISLWHCGSIYSEDVAIAEEGLTVKRATNFGLAMEMAAMQEDGSTEATGPGESGGEVSVHRVHQW